eukprot:364096-Chlamydomonas_euryale.AAC.12
MSVNQHLSDAQSTLHTVTPNFWAQKLSSGFAIRGCHEECSGGGTALRDTLKLTSRTQLIPWPEIRAEASESALDRQIWRDAIINLAPLAFKKLQQVGHVCDRLPGSSTDPGLGLVNGALCNDCDFAAEDVVEVIASGKASVTSHLVEAGHEWPSQLQVPEANGGTQPRQPMAVD